MSGPSAAYPRKVQIAPDSSGTAGSYADLELQGAFDTDEMFDMDDISQQNSAGAHIRLPTLQDTKFSGSILYDSSATAQNTIRNAGRTQVWVKVFFTATTGFYFPGYVSSKKTTFDPAKVQRQNFEITGTAAPTTF